MQTTYESLRAFIASPSDVAEERGIVEKIIKDINRVCKETLGVEIECVSWDDFIPQTPNLPEEKIQDILNAEIPQCQIFILILWQRYGSNEPGNEKSNTQREVEIALELLKKKKKIIFLTYFRDLPVIFDKGPQRNSVEEFRDTLQYQGVWSRRYGTVPQFQEILTHDLYRTILRFRLSTKKHAALRKFWVFGTPDRPTYPNLAIIYPSMERTFMGPHDDPDIWLNRLEPNMVFEDVKALQKLEKTLRILGFSNFRIYNTGFIPSDIRFMNRFWICLRNIRGLQQLNHHYKDIARFDIIPRKNRADSYFRWKMSAPSSQSFNVHSPLAKYLREQRSKMDVSGNWHLEMDHIVAKDFAILARFRDTQNTMAMKENYLNDYFIAGIRGLGTWGAAWFIDRKYQVFEKIDEEQDFQFLLEIEYQDGRICDVRDVSDKPKEYFDEENDLTTIRKNIAAYKT
jgi:hypothetical protein